MRLDQLRNFVWLVKIKSFTEAAEKLHMSTSALSKSIKSLEEKVGTQLINRDTTPLSVTRVGGEFYEFAVEASAEYEYFTQKYRKDRKVSFEQIRIFSMPASDELFITEALGKTAPDYPNVEFIHVSRSAFTLYSDLLAQDASLLVVPDFEFARPLHEGFECIALPPMKFGSYCRPGHPILDREAIAFADLWEYPVSGPQLPKEVDDMVVEFVGQDKFKRRPLFNVYFEHTATAHKTVLDSDTIAVSLSEMAVKPLVDSGVLCQIPVLPNMFQSIGSNLLIKQEARRSNALKALVDNILACAARRS